ncbi:hypothetical protein D3C76_1529460 [compost metagenome]
MPIRYPEDGRPRRPAAPQARITALALITWKSAVRQSNPITPLTAPSLSVSKRVQTRRLVMLTRARFNCR